MRIELLLTASALVGLTACQAPPPPPRSKAKTAIQHDQPQPASMPPQVAAGPLPPGADTSQLPPDHPQLGDGSSTHDQGQLPPGHPGVKPDASSKALLAKVEAMKDELKGRPKTIEVTVALGSLYYDNGRYLDAIDYYRQAITQGDSLVKDFKGVVAQAGEAKPSTLQAAGCDRSVVKDSEPMMTRAKLLASQGKQGFALACANEAIRPVVMAHQRRGNAFYLVGNPGEAVHEHEQALALAPNDAESLFFKGAILFDAKGDDVPSLKAAQAAWTQFLKVAPDSPRAHAVKQMLPKLAQAIELGGASKLPRPAPTEVADSDQGPGAPPAPGMAGPLSAGAQQAVMSTEITPELLKGFGTILDQATAQLAKADVDGARTNIIRVFPFVMADLQRPTHKVPPELRARTQALMGLYMAGKGAPMGGVMIQQAVSASPKTVDALADALKAQGDAAHARTLWKSIALNAADYAKTANVAAKL